MKRRCEENMLHTASHTVAYYTLWHYVTRVWLIRHTGGLYLGAVLNRTRFLPCNSPLFHLFLCLPVPLSFVLPKGTTRAVEAQPHPLLRLQANCPHGLIQARLRTRPRSRAPLRPVLPRGQLAVGAYGDHARTSGKVGLVSVPPWGGAGDDWTVGRLYCGIRLFLAVAFTRFSAPPLGGRRGGVDVVAYEPGLAM